MLHYSLSCKEYIDPSSKIINQELHHSMLKFCSFVSIHHGKKLSLVNIFILLYNDENYRNIFMEITSIDNKIEVFRKFLLLDQNIIKSKLIKKNLKINE